MTVDAARGSKPTCVFPTRAPRTIVVALVAAEVGCAGGKGPADLEEPLCDTVTVPYPRETTLTGDTRDVHDPEIVRDGDAWYVLSTNDGIQIRRSTDLLDWTFVGRVFPDGVPAWGRAEIPGVQSPWAPAARRVGDRYLLYYSLSTFGSQRSAIGLATTTTLDPDSPAYAWHDLGKVMESFPGDEYNAIDPAVATDAAGGLWLAWGSWWGGIGMRALDPSTGGFSGEDRTLHSLARRPVEQALEGAYIVHRGDDYYLFASFDLCCRGVESTYNVRVGRSVAIRGPYLDREGVPMLEGGGSPVLTGYGRVRGPGHASVLVEDGRYLLVHHYYDAGDGGRPHLQIRPLVWDEEGWPLAGLPWDGTPPGPAPADPGLSGRWGYWVGDEAARPVELLPDGTVVGCNAGGSWSYDAPTLTVRWSATGAGGDRMDRSILSADGAWLVGLASDGRIARGYRLPDPG